MVQTVNQTGPTTSQKTTDKKAVRYDTPYRFHGGIHPDEHKTLSNQQPIKELTPPPQVSIYLGQHSGQPATPLAKAGDYVKRGQLIGAAQGSLSANIHASVSGVVQAVEERPVAHASGMRDWCVVIDNDGKDDTDRLDIIEQPLTQNRQRLLDRIFDAGIVGMGGAGFPSHIKLMPTVNHLIINAAECEPYITCDDRLMQDYADELIASIHLLQYLVGAQQVTIGIEDNKPQAIQALETSILKTSEETTGQKDLSSIQICVVPTKYPSGGEKQLIELVTGKQVPSRQLPLSLGIILHNVATALAIYRAVTQGEALTSRVMTITGNGAQQPGNYWTRIGTPFEWILEQQQVPQESISQMIMGGPMMGFALPDFRAGTLKSTNCVFVSTADELQPAQNSLACIRCSLCAEACPASLLPQQLYWFAKSENLAKAEEYQLFDCIECGACSYVCPSEIPLVQYYRFAKAEIIQKSEEKARSAHAKKRHELRELRLEREKAERAEKHRKAAEARKKAAADKGVGDEKKATIADAVARAKARKQQQESSN